MALRTNYEPGEGGHAAAHNATNTVVNALNTDTGWINMSTLSNNFYRDGAVSAVPAYRQIGKIVYLSGVLYRNTAPGSGFLEVFVLPSGFRPRARFVTERNYPWNHSIQVIDTGSVQVRSDVARSSSTVGTAGFTLDGISFPVD